MTAEKHLVLSFDVYEKLKRKKKLTGLSLKDIGNALLRSALTKPILAVEIGEKLVAQGKISFEDYQKILVETTLDFQRSSSHIFNLVERTPEGTFVSGSWEWKELYKAQDDSFQVLHCWARDLRKKAMPPHCHEESECLIVLIGKILLQTELQSRIMNPGESASIPSNQVHGGVPLTRDACSLQINIPALQAYTSRAEDGVT